VDVTRDLVGQIQGPPSAGAALSRPWPLALVVPFVDLVALAVAAMLAGGTFWSASLFVAGALVLLNSGGWRFPRLDPRIRNDITWIATRVAILTVVLLPFAAESTEVSELARTAAWAVLLLPAGRAISYAVIRTARIRGWMTERAVVVGGGPIAATVTEVLRTHTGYGLRPIGYLDEDQGRGTGAPSTPWLGTVGQLEDVVRDHQVTRVIVAFGTAREVELVQVFRDCEDLPVAVHCVPRFFELRLPERSPRVDDIWGIPLVCVSRPGSRSVARRVKRGMDVLLSALSLLLLAPVLFGGALAVKLSSPGPVLFRQVRVGEGGRPFRVLKLRTMVVNDDADTAWNVADDERVTRPGAFLRATSIDELPQLWNVLRGEMSLVGPRPERPHFVEEFDRSIPHYRDRLRVPAGITGWAQVHGLRGDTSISERIRFDNSYIENWSLWLDVAIIGRTVRQLVAGGGHMPSRRTRDDEMRRPAA
jgi:exopolysaccharide biosynthesis polyprenyl glycosylphosphotransferase